MLDLKFVRSHPEIVQAGARKKRIQVDVERILVLDQESRALGVRIDELRGQQKQAGAAIASASADERPVLLEAQRVHKAELKELEELQGGLDVELRELLLRLPSVPADDVPEGADDKENVVVRQVGTPPAFDFEVRDHVAIGELHGWIDVERGARLAGSRNYVLRGELVQLEAAVMRFAMDLMVGKGYLPVTVPTLVRTDAMLGTGYFPGGEEQAYRCDERDDLWLVGTAEVPLTALYQGEILRHEDLPCKMVALSSCYRREAGTYGRDTRGLYRVHQFQKVEQVILGENDEARSLAYHQEILANSEELVQALGLAYQVVNVCGGDLGQGQVQKFDIETWMPGRGGYGETHSASRFHDFQARRLDLRYRDADGKVQHCHTLNNTVAASTRLLIALLENHQTAEGAVRVPECLRPYLGGRSLLGSA